MTWRFGTDRWRLAWDGGWALGARRSTLCVPCRSDAKHTADQRRAQEKRAVQSKDKMKELKSKVKDLEAGGTAAPTPATLASQQGGNEADQGGPPASGRECPGLLAAEYKDAPAMKRVDMLTEKERGGGGVVEVYRAPKCTGFIGNGHRCARAGRMRLDARRATASVKSVADLTGGGPRRSAIRCAACTSFGQNARRRMPSPHGLGLLSPKPPPPPPPPPAEANAGGATATGATTRRCQALDFHKFKLSRASNPALVQHEVDQDGALVYVFRHEECPGPEQAGKVDDLVFMDAALMAKIKEEYPIMFALLQDQAKYMLQFSWTSLDGGFRYVLGYVLTDGVSAEQLAKAFMDALAPLMAHKFVPLFATFDGAAPNQSWMRTFATPDGHRLYVRDPSKYDPAGFAGLPARGGSRGGAPRAGRPAPQHHPAGRFGRFGNRPG